MGHISHAHHFGGWPIRHQMSPRGAYGIRRSCSVTCHINKVGALSSAAGSHEAQQTVGSDSYHSVRVYKLPTANDYGDITSRVGLCEFLGL